MTRQDVEEIMKAFKRCSENDQTLQGMIERLVERVLTLEARLNKLKWLETA